MYSMGWFEWQGAALFAGIYGTSKQSESVNNNLALSVVIALTVNSESGIRKVSRGQWPSWAFHDPSQMQPQKGCDWGKLGWPGYVSSVFGSPNPTLM